MFTNEIFSSSILILFCSEILFVFCGYTRYYQYLAKHKLRYSTSSPTTAGQVLNIYKMSDIKMLMEINRTETLLKKLATYLKPPSNQTEPVHIGIIGGAEGNTIAPYFTGRSASESGAQMIYIFCENYYLEEMISSSGGLTVLPLYDEDNKTNPIIISKLDNIHSLIIGPGIFCTEANFEAIETAIKHLKKKKEEIYHIPLIFVSEAYNFLLIKNETIIDYPGYIYIVINVLEMKNLASVYLTNERKNFSFNNNLLLKKMCGNIHEKAIIILQGDYEKIITPSDVFTCSTIGEIQRCLGYSSIVSGLLGLFSHWARSYRKKMYRNSLYTPEVLAGFAACAVFRLSSKFAYEGGQKFRITKHFIKQLTRANEFFFYDRDLTTTTLVTSTA